VISDRALRLAALAPDGWASRPYRAGRCTNQRNAREFAAEVADTTASGAQGFYRITAD